MKLLKSCDIVIRKCEIISMQFNCSKDIIANDYINMFHFNYKNTSLESFSKMVKSTRQIDSTTETV